MKPIFSIFQRGLQKTTTAVKHTLASMFSSVTVWDQKTFDQLEAALIQADFGVKASTAIVSEIKDRYEHGVIATTSDIIQVAQEYVAKDLAIGQRPIRTAPEGPTIILFVGVNGSGKTTTIGKLAARWKEEGKKVMLAAGDTFRAAAVEQLQLWGERVGVPVIAAAHGADPASVAFDAAMAARARKMDYLLIDTAGRQQNKKSLMDELAKICRSIDKVLPGAPHEVWLTVDSSMGANALSQAREFSKTAKVSGIVLTKLDGTGRGGMALALHQEFQLPTFFVGLGEQPGDLQPFNPEYYAAAIFGDGRFPQEG